MAASRGSPTNSHRPRYIRPKIKSGTTVAELGGFLGFFLIFIDFHWFSLIFKDFNEFLSISLIIIDFHRFSLFFIYFH